MSISSIISGGFAVVRTRPRLVAFWVVVQIVLYGAFTAITLPISRAMLAAQAAGPNNPAAFAAIAPYLGAVFLGALVLMVVYVAAFSSIVRAVAQPAGDRLGYIRFGGDEFRLIGLGLLFVVAAFLAELVLILLFAILTGLVIAAGGRTVAAALFPILGIVFLGAMIFLEVRLSLAGALTVLRKKIIIGESWRATHGRFWMLFAAYFILFAVFVAVSLMLMGITNASLLIAYARLDPVAIRAASTAQQLAGITPWFIFTLVVSSVVNGLALAIFSGAVTTAALELTSPAADMAEVFS